MIKRPATKLLYFVCISCMFDAVTHISHFLLRSLFAIHFEMGNGEESLALAAP